jgi:DHA1 family bicyclomycin/chloramphenicol resistance-like MFS transporter
VLLKYFRSERIVIVALIGQAIVAVLYLIESYNGWFGLSGTLAMIFLILCGVGIINPNASALSLAPFSKNAGTASSLMGAMQLGIGAFATYSVSLFTTISPFSMAVIIFISSIIALCILLVGRHFIVEEIEPDKSAMPVGH